MKKNLTNKSSCVIIIISGARLIRAVFHGRLGRAPGGQEKRLFYLKGCNMELENKILAQINKALGDAIIKELVGYDKPLSKITEDVIESHYNEIYNIIDTEVSGLIRCKAFKGELKKALNAKLAKIMISKIGGTLEKQVNKLRSNPETNAKITLAITKLIDEILGNNE